MGDGADALVGLGEELTGRADAQGDDVFVRRDPGMLLKGAPEGGAAHACHLGQRIDVDRLLERAVDIFDCQQRRIAFGTAVQMSAGIEEDFPQDADA